MATLGCLNCLAVGGSAGMSKFVISYRRADSAAMAGRICDRLKARYGEATVYMDIDNVPPGIDFRLDVHAALDQADVLIVVIGQKWLGVRRDGHDRIADDHDFVRIEVEAALKRGIPVVPVLVNGASMPDPSSLPENIRPLAFRNAMYVDAGIDFHQHMTRLERSLDRLPGAGRPIAAFLQGLDRTRLTLGILLPIVAVAAVWSAVTFWWPTGIGNKAEIAKREMGGPLVRPPPPGRSVWTVEKSTVYLEPTGDKRQFFLVEPGLELANRGAQSGALLFDGRKVDASYEGKLFVFAGRCGTRDYDASGPITNDGQTVTLTGSPPQIDPESCQRTGEQQETLVFNYKRVAN